MSPLRDALNLRHSSVYKKLNAYNVAAQFGSDRKKVFLLSMFGPRHQRRCALSKIARVGLFGQFRGAASEIIVRERALAKDVPYALAEAVADPAMLSLAARQ